MPPKRAIYGSIFLAYVTVDRTERDALSSEQLVHGWIEPIAPRPSCSLQAFMLLLLYCVEVFFLELTLSSPRVLGAITSIPAFARRSTDLGHSREDRR